MRMTFIRVILSIEMSEIEKRVEQPRDAQKQRRNAAEAEEREQHPGENGAHHPHACRGDERSEDRQALQKIEECNHRQEVRADLLRQSSQQRRDAADNEREEKPFG